MSLAVTGLGEIYSGYPQRGILYTLLRAASCLAVPFYSLVNTKSTLLPEVLISIIFFLAITIISPLNTILITVKKKKIALSRYNSPGFYTSFILINLFLTLLSVSVFFCFFSIIKIQKDYPAFIEKDDIIVIKKIGNSLYKKGEMIMLNNENTSIVRIISIPGENVSYDKGRFSVDGSELILSIFNDNDLKNFSLTDYDVISESNGYYKYPVIQNRGKLKLNYNLKQNEYFTAPDDRNDTSGFQIIKPEIISGRIEGKLYSVRRSKFALNTFQIDE